MPKNNSKRRKNERRQKVIDRLANKEHWMPLNFARDETRRHREHLEAIQMENTRWMGWY